MAGRGIRSSHWGIIGGNKVEVRGNHVELGAPIGGKKVDSLWKLCGGTWNYRSSHWWIIGGNKIDSLWKLRRIGRSH